MTEKVLLTLLTVVVIYLLRYIERAWHAEEEERQLKNEYYKRVGEK